MMLLLLLTACGRDPSPPPASPEPDAARRLTITLGRARQSPDHACEAVEAALQAAAAAPDGELPFGLRRDGVVQPDWHALADAFPAGDLQVAMVTLGGLVSMTKDPCLDPERLDVWSRRIPQIDRLPVCRDTLVAPTTALLETLRDRCTCTPVSEVQAGRLAVRTKRVAPATAARYADWTTAPVCVRE
jgi:hypothetical protein